MAPALATDSSIVEPDRLPQRHLVQGRPRVRVEDVEAGGDGVLQAGARDEPAAQPPDPAVLAELSAVDGGEDELAGVEHVALADGPDRVDGVGRDRARRARWAAAPRPGCG